MEEKNGGVYVKASEETIKKNRKALSIACKPQGKQQVLVVGGGSGAIGVIEGLRSSGFDGAITVISKEGFRPYDRTKLSKALLADESKLAWRSPEFYSEGGVEFVEGEVTGVDFSSKEVSTKGGKTYNYTKLVLASGGTPRWLPLPGLKGDLKNVFVLRSIPDVQSILDALRSGSKKVVVVGSSFIGMEVANKLASDKHDVSVIGMESEPMERVMGAKIGKVVRTILEKNGLKFYMSASVEKATPSKSDSSLVGAVHLKDGTELEADLVIEGVGIAPATEYLRENKSVQLLKDGSLKTDGSFKVDGLEDVFAIGGEMTLHAISCRAPLTSLQTLRPTRIMAVLRCASRLVVNAFPSLLVC